MVFRPAPLVLLVMAFVGCDRTSGEGRTNVAKASPEPAPAAGAPAVAGPGGPPDPAMKAAPSAGSGPASPTPPGGSPAEPEPASLGAPPPEVAATVTLKLLARGFDRPVAVVDAPGDGTDRLFVVEQGGKILTLHDGAKGSVAALDLSKRVGRRHNEQGLLGLAFHPRFAQNGRLFVNYTDRKGTTRIVEFRISSDPTVIDPEPVRELLSIEQPWGNHNGGHLLFGPDGLLYVGTGDGGSAGDPKGAAQSPRSMLGKMLRFDVDSPAAPPQVVAKGLRNPWRYSFDRKTGDLYLGDVGQNEWEWIHVVPAGQLDGANFGWNVAEGLHCFGKPKCDRTGFVTPVLEYDHDTGCSITGGYVSRSPELPRLAGHYFYADYCTGLLRSLRWTGRGVTDLWDWKAALDRDGGVEYVTSFGEGEGGELYLVTLTGRVYRFAAP